MSTTITIVVAFLFVCIALNAETIFGAHPGFDTTNREDDHQQVGKEMNKDVSKDINKDIHNMDGTNKIVTNKDVNKDKQVGKDIQGEFQKKKFKVSEKEQKILIKIRIIKINLKLELKIII